VIISLKESLGSEFNFELQRAWEVTYAKLKEGLVSNNYVVEPERGLSSN